MAISVGISMRHTLKNINMSMDIFIYQWDSIGFHIRISVYVYEPRCTSSGGGSAPKTPWHQSASGLHMFIHSFCICIYVYVYTHNH